MGLLEMCGQIRAQDPGVLGRAPPLMGQDEEQQAEQAEVWRSER